VPCVDGWKSKNVAKKNTISFRILAEEDYMSARDHEPNSFPRRRYN